MALKKRFVASLLVLTVIALVTASASAVGTPSWRAAHEVPLPSSALGIASGFLPALSCPVAGYCAAGGDETLVGGTTGALVLNEVKGDWVDPVTLSAPTGASGDAGLELNWLSCGAKENCAAGGSYVATTGVQAFVANQVGGGWSGAHEVALPGNALVHGQEAEVRWVSCPVANNCVAVGGYLDDLAVSRDEAFVVNETGGVWGSAKEVTFLTPANFNPFATLNQVACSSRGDCVAVGSFIDRHDVQEALVDREVHGTWLGASALALPLDASAFAAASTGEVDCVRGGPCTVVGSYLNERGGVEAFVDHENAGVWSRASVVAMPAGARSNPEVFNFGFRGLDCASKGNCTLGGQYENAAGQYEGFFANEVKGTWRSAREILLPGGATSVGHNGGVVAVTCPRVGACRAGADYLDAEGNYQGLLVSEVHGLWRRGVKVALPGGATSVGADGGVYALVCPTTRTCVATGSYETPSAFRAFTVTT